MHVANVNVGGYLTNKDKGVINEHYQVACEKSSYDLRPLGGNMPDIAYMDDCVSLRTLRMGYELQGARSQMERALESARSVVGSCLEDSLERALEYIENAEHHLYALQSECRGSGDNHRSETTDSSLKEEEFVLVTPVQGVQGGGRLVLGDSKLVRADTLKS